MIAAFLTLLGYSINDTIVIYDRIRENRRKGVLTAQLINNSINETLSRTLLTSTTTLLVLIVMYIFGGKGLRGFNFAMLFGIIEGTYSSIAISAPILLLRFKISDKKAKEKAKEVSVVK
jgi:SecD/SecF fusion protein